MLPNDISEAGLTLFFLLFFFFITTEVGLPINKFVIYKKITEIYLRFPPYGTIYFSCSCQSA